MNVNERNAFTTVLELKRLLVELKEKRPDICIRYRLMGEMWKENFVRIVAISDDRLFIEDSRLGVIFQISNIRNIIQFELDQSFYGYHPHFHYDVVLDQQS